MLEKLVRKYTKSTNEFRTKYWVEINDNTRETYKTNSQIRFKAEMSRSRLCDYSDAYILASGTIIITK